MKTLSLLTRPSPPQTVYRKTYGNVDMVKRKQLRRMKKINIYHKQLTGESNPNAWFNSKRLKAAATHLQNVKNNHIGTNPIPPETRKQILKTMTQLSEYQYYNFRNRNQQLAQFQQLIQSCDIQSMIDKLPAKLRKDIKNSQAIQNPEITEPLLKYTQQIQVFMPQDQRYRYNLLLKIQHPPKVKLESEQTPTPL